MPDDQDRDSDDADELTPRSAASSPDPDAIDTARYGNGARRRVRTNPQGVPAAPPAPPVLSPCRPADEDEPGSRRGRARRRRHMDTTGRIDIVTEEVETVSETADELEKRVKELEGFKRRVFALASAALIAAGGSALAVARGLYERGEREGAASIRLQYLEREVDELRRSLRDVGDRFVPRRRDDSDPPWPPRRDLIPPSQPALKGTAP